MCKIFRSPIILLTLVSLTMAVFRHDLVAQSTYGNQFSEPVDNEFFTLTTVHMDETSLIMELRLHEYVLSPRSLGDQIYQELIVVGMNSVQKPGQPEIPSLGQMIGTPSSGISTVRVLEIETETRERIDLLPVPAISELNISGRIDEQFRVSEKAYARDRLLPDSPATVGMTGKLREQSVAQVILNPFQYNPYKRTLLIHHRIRIAVDFRATTRSMYNNRSIYNTEKWESSSVQASGQSSPFEAVLQSALINYAALPVVSDTPGGQVRNAPVSPASYNVRDSKSVQIKIAVNESGLYQVPFAQISETGFDFDGIDPRKLQLRHKDQDVAIQIAGEDDGIADPTDSLVFYGEASKSPFSMENIYWLTVGESRGLRIQAGDGSLTDESEIPTSYYYLHTERWESNEEYWKDLPAADISSDGDGLPVLPSVEEHWFWARIPSGQIGKEFTFRLSNVLRVPEATTNDAKLEGRITLRLFGRTETDENPDHHTVISLNGRRIDDVFWDGKEAMTREIQVSHNLLLEGENRIKIVQPGDTQASVDSVYLDYFEVTHWSERTARGDQLEFRSAGGPRRFSIGGFSAPDIEVYDLRESLQPHRIANGVVQTEVRDDTQYFRIEFEDNVPSSGRHLVIHSEEKLSPSHIEVYEPRSLSLKSPDNQADYLIITHSDFLDAIQPLAEHRRSTGLTVQTLDVADVYHEFSHGMLTPTAIRDFIAYAYNHWQQPAPLYVLFVGDANYDYQDFLETGHQNYVPTALFNSPVIGQTPTDNWFVSVSGDDFLPDLFVGRIAATTPNQVSSAVDKILSYESMSDLGGWATKSLFVAENEANFQQISDQLIGQLPYGYEASKVYGIDYPDPPTATPQIKQAIDQGVSLINFIGHGSVTDWYWNELIFGLDDIPKLQNGPNYPFLVTGSCNNGLFAHPTKQVAFAEEFVNANNRGGIGVWSPTGLGYAYWHEKLIEALYEEFFDNDTLELGPATTAAKINAYAQLGWREPVEISTLFGDPALSLHIVKPKIDLRLSTISDVPYIGESHTYEIVVVNNDVTSIDDLTLSLQLTGSHVNEATPAPLPNSNLWKFDTIAPGSDQKIAVTVGIASDLPVNSLVRIDAQLSIQGTVIMSRELSDSVKERRPDVIDVPQPVAPTPQIDPNDNDSLLQLYIPLIVEYP